ncbi:MAG: hypothetical protein CO167_12095 [Candidatus Marinimicrobia bacterium CG_4_9_14_3_um_filter_48_9]|nr:MAG: hypothetical protein CO167_12095 [Candidatus Marinimicrobia bacterium CG_4_9_14_3_um_filter_48_9]
MKKLLYIPLTLMFIFSIGYAQSNSDLYREANKLFQSYRYKVPFENFQVRTFQEDGKEVLELLIIINARRNNFDEAMLVGFGAAGAAIAKTGSKIDLVNVVIKVQYKEEISISAIADAPDTIKLYENKISPSSFMSKIIFH